MYSLFFILIGDQGKLDFLNKNDLLSSLWLTEKVYNCQESVCVLPLEQMSLPRSQFSLLSLWVLSSTSLLIRFNCDLALKSLH